MANSVFVNAFGVVSGGGTLAVSHKLAVTDATGEVQVGNDGFIYWINRAVLKSPADSQVNLTDNAVSVGVGLDVATDAVMKVRTRAQTGYATVDALGLKASGVAGANFGPGGVASLTVVNGIVTAVS